MPCKRPHKPATPPQGDLVSLASFAENPDNPQTVTAENFARLVEKVRRLPEGLKANSIAFVRDDARRALKAIYGKAGSVPAEWFVDVTGMSEKERREFLVNMNVNEGAWDVEKLMEQYSPDELNAAGLAAIVDSMSGIESLIEMGDEMGDGEEADGPTGAGLVTLKIPPEYIPAWRSYKRTQGTDRIVDFITKELQDTKKKLES